MKDEEIHLTPTMDPDEIERDLRRVATFTVAPELLAAAMELPEGTEIIGAEWDHACRGVRLFVRGPQFPSIVPGCLPSTVMPTVSMHIDDAGNRRFSYEWWPIDRGLTPTGAPVDISAPVPTDPHASGPNPK